MSRYTSFRDFYPFYLSQHANRTCRRLHFVGSWLVLIVLFSAITTGNWLWLWALPVLGYGFCWRRFKIEPPCRLNFEPGLLANL